MHSLSQSAGAGVKISVITCTHNPRTSYLTRVIDSLRAQTLDTASWEYLLIDNASDEIAVDATTISWHAAARLVREDSLGLTPARLRAIREAKGELLVFVDDDNVLSPDFLAQALRIAQQRPDIGAWSGQCFAEFETTPPTWTRRYWGLLVVRQFEHDVWSNLPNLADTMPCGAGLCVRRSVARHYLDLHVRGERAMQFDRRGASLMSAGDNDLAACACDIGLGVGLFKDLQLTHLIPTSRLSEPYLTRLAEGVHFSSVLFRSLREPQPAVTWKRRLANFLRQCQMSRMDARMFRAACRGEQRAAGVLDARRRDTGEPCDVVARRNAA